MTDPVKFDSGKDWTFEEIESIYLILEKIARDDYGLEYYPNQIEVITSEQMLDAYAAVGMPTYYSHWSFGKQFVKESEMYKRGHMGLAYEIVINSNPCVSYLMEENTMAMQSLVIAHACFGHNSFFKNNVNFKQWTDADAIIDYLVFAKGFIADCEEKYGWKEVEAILDAAHALHLNGIDRYKRPITLSKVKKKAKQKARDDYEHEQFDDIWRTIPPLAEKIVKDKNKFPSEPEDNVLYFIEKHAPNLDPWKREIIRIVRKISQYFYPQMLTKVMNEGWASFWHYTLMNDLYDKGFVTDGFMLEFLTSHSAVMNQRQFGDLNPYALGFAMYQDIKRIAMDPTDEDREWFSWAGNGDWLSTLKEAAFNFKDESFILQYLSPKVIRDFQLFYVLDDDENPEMHVEAIQNDMGYRQVREKLAEQHNVNNALPYIQVTNVDVWGDRSMELRHYTTQRRKLEHGDVIKSLRYLAFLWGYPVRLITVDSNEKNVDVYEYDPDKVDITIF